MPKNEKYLDPLNVTLCFSKHSKNYVVFPRLVLLLALCFRKCDKKSKKVTIRGRHSNVRSKNVGHKLKKTVILKLRYAEITVTFLIEIFFSCSKEI